MVMLLLLLYARLYLLVAWTDTMVTICVACLFMVRLFSCHIMLQVIPSNKSCKWTRVMKIYSTTWSSETKQYLSPWSGGNFRVQSNKSTYKPPKQGDVGSNPIQDIQCPAENNALAKRYVPTNCRFLFNLKIALLTWPKWNKILQQEDVRPFSSSSRLLFLFCAYLTSDLPQANRKEERVFSYRAQ